ncbi:MAG: phosphoadenosine phosphosulfate reductase family protein [Clostridium sp.]
MELLIENTLLGEINKEEKAIQRIVEFQNKQADKRNIIAFSGGKDSIVLKHLIQRAGIECEFIYSQTSVDPPELIYYIREHHKDVKFQSYGKFKDTQQTITMWNLIPRKLMPPSRMVRYCCDFMKERTGEEGDTVFLGVRWAEGSKRSKQSMVGFWKGKTVVRPMIEWTDEDIWEYIHKYNLPYCKLYDQGFKRIGCIGCPLSSNQKRELELYPKIKANYIRAFDKMLVERHRKGKVCKWETGEEVMKWWIGEATKTKQIEGQCSFMGD